MNTLVIYDGTGYIISKMSGEVREPVGIPFLYVDVPEGQTVTNIDVTVTPHQVILEDIPPTEIDILKAKLQTTQEAVDFLLMGGI